MVGLREEEVRGGIKGEIGEREKGTKVLPSGTFPIMFKTGELGSQYTC